MKVKAIKTEWFQDYKVPSMFIATSKCTWKCEKELNMRVCQNSALAQLPDIDVDIDELIRKYLSNAITSAVVFGGLEPFEQMDEVIAFIKKLREEYDCHDDVVIYTGYYPIEKKPLEYMQKLEAFDNIVIKWGRYRPNCESVYDEVLGVTLVSDNQFGERIS